MTTFDLDQFQSARDEQTFRVAGTDYTRARLGHALRMKLADVEQKVQVIQRRTVTVIRDYGAAVDDGQDENAATLEAKARTLAADREKLDIEYIRLQLRDPQGKQPPAKAFENFDATSLQALQDALAEGAKEDERDPTAPTATPGATPPS